MQPSVLPPNSNRPRIHAYVWWCGDYVCNCTQAVIELVEAVRDSPTGEYFTPFRHRIKRTRLWEGEYFSEDWTGAEDELIFAKERILPGIVRASDAPYSDSDFDLAMLDKISYGDVV